MAHEAHTSHPAIIKRLKRANGHLRSIIDMIEAERPCVDIAQQLQAVESTIHNAKRTLIQDHMEHCIGEGVDHGGANAKQTLSEFKTLSNYL